MRKYLFVLGSTFLCTFSLPLMVWAQTNSPEESQINEIESILDKDEGKDEEVVAPAKEEAVPESIANLKNLQPFSDIAVIQRKFLPKTKRFEIFGGGSTIVNNPFFINFGILGRLAFHFSEALAAEFVFNSLTTSNREVTNDLLSKHGVQTNGLVAPEQYFGGSAVWTPIYGKMALFENRIVPFDLYFAGGGGFTKTNQGESALTWQLSTGQRFALNKRLAFRWDFTWNFYSATFTPSSTGNQTPAKQTGNFDNLFLSIGISFFFPEARYR